MRRDSGGQKQAGQDAPFERDAKVVAGRGHHGGGLDCDCGHGGGAIGAAPKSFTAHEQVLAARLAQAVQWQSLAQVNMVRTQAQVLGQASEQGQPFAQRIATTGQEIEGLVQALQAGAQTPQDKLQLQQVQQLREQALQQRQKIFAADGDATSQIAQTYLPAAQAYLQGIEGLVQHTGQSLAALRSEMGAARQGVVRGAVINILVCWPSLRWVLTN